MITSDELKRVDSGSGYFIGEVSENHKHLTYLRPGALVTLFDGLDTALDFVTTNMAEAKEGKSSVDYDPGFNTFRTYDEALKIFRTAPEQVTKFDPSELRIKDNSESGTQVDYDVTGDYIDMGRYMEGIPESIGTMHQGNARNRRVNIMVNLNQWHGIKEDVINHRSERILRLIDALEAGGVRTRLTAIESTQCSHTEIVIKRHEEPLTITDLAVVNHSEFLRRVIFRVVEYSKTFSMGYGSAMSFGSALTPEFIAASGSKLNDELDIIIDANMNYVSDIDRNFDQLERLLVWEMSKPVPEVTSVKVDARGIYFNPNGARDEMEIRREGQEAIRDDG